MPKVRLFVEGIDVQKDKYRPRQPDPLLDKDTLLDTDGFLALEDDQVHVEHFKRFVAGGRVETEGRTGKYQVTISLRGNIVTVSARKDGPVTSYGVFWMLETHLMRWNHRRHEGGIDRERPLLAVDDHKAKAIRATTRDGFWMADVLHHIKDDKETGVLFEDFPEQFMRR